MDVHVGGAALFAPAAPAGAFWAAARCVAAMEKTTAENPPQAYLWEQMLREEGIKAKVVGEYLDAGIGDIPGMAAEVWVEAADLARAEAILDQHRGRPERAGQPGESPQVPCARGSKSDTGRATRLSQNRCGGE